MEKEEKYYGHPMKDYIKGILSEFERDGINIGGMAGDQKSFNLSDEETEMLIREFVLQAMAIGAVPVFFGRPQGLDYEWVQTNRFGRTQKEIADNIIKEWKKVKLLSNWDNTFLDIGGLWFALPRKNSPNYVKLLNKPK